MRSSVSLGHKLIAIFLAIAAFAALYFFRYHQAQQASAATLSVDPAAIGQLALGIKGAPDSVVALAQSALSDSLVSRLAAAGPAASSPLVIGQFRARLELAQPSAGLLSVRYLDPDPSQATATANAIADALAAWTPSGAGDSQPSARENPPQAVTPASPALASVAAPPQISSTSSSLAGPLKELEAQLSAALQRAGPDSSLKSDRDRQRYLESQVRAAQQSLSQLRSKFADANSASRPQAQIDAIAHALARFWPFTVGLNTAGASEAQLNYERDQLTRDIALVRQQQQAAQPAVSNPSPQPLPQQPVPVAAQPQATPDPAIAAPSDLRARQNPFHLQQRAAVAAPVIWWPLALIGCLCGLLYLGIVFAMHRTAGELDDSLGLAEETEPSSQHLITPPVSARSDSREPFAEIHEAEPWSRRRSSFSFEPEPEKTPHPETHSSWEREHEVRHDRVSASESEPTAVAPATEEPVADSAESAVAVPPATTKKETPDQFTKETPDQFAKETPDQSTRAEATRTPDPWSEVIRKTLSETTVARSLIAPAESESAAAKPPAREEAPAPTGSGRRTG